MKVHTLFLALTACFGATYTHTASAATQLEVASELNWTTNYSAARQHAIAENKPLFLYFSGSDWCTWCKKMNTEILSTPAFQQALGDRLIFVKIDFPRNIPQDEELKKQNKILKEEFGINGFPSVILLAPNGNLISRLGYQAGGGALYAQKILDILNK